MLTAEEGEHHQVFADSEVAHIGHVTLADAIPASQRASDVESNRTI